jgi:hypothetical protein
MFYADYIPAAVATLHIALAVFSSHYVERGSRCRVVDFNEIVWC